MKFFLHQWRIKRTKHNSIENIVEDYYVYLIVVRGHLFKRTMNEDNDDEKHNNYGLEIVLQTTHSLWSNQLLFDFSKEDNFIFNFEFEFFLHTGDADLQVAFSDREALGTNECLIFRISGEADMTGRHSM